MPSPTVAPSVGSNADVFRNIIDYRLDKKKEILDYLLSQESIRTDPALIKQQWELLRVQYQRLTQMDKDLTDIRQGIQSSADGVLKNIVSGNAQLRSANVRASSESEKLKVGAVLDVDKMIEDKDKEGRSAVDPLLDKAVEAGNAFVASPGAEGPAFAASVRLLWDTDYASKYNALKDPVAKARFQKSWYDHVAQMKAQAAVNNPGVLSSGRTTVQDARDASGLPYIDEGVIGEVKVEQKKKLDALVFAEGYEPAGDISAPTFAERAGIPDNVDAIYAAYQRAFQGRIKIEHPAWYDETGALKSDRINDFNKLKDDEAALKTFIQSVPDNEKLFLLDSTNIDKELQRRKLQTALDAESRKLREGETPKSLADIENQAVIEYNRLYGTPKQKELIAQYSRAKELTAGTDLSQDIIFGNILSGAIDRVGSGQPLSASFIKDMMREQEAVNTASQSRNRTPDIIPPRTFSDATVKEMLDNGWAVERQRDLAIVVQGEGLKGDTILRPGIKLPEGPPEPALTPDMVLPRRGTARGGKPIGNTGFYIPAGFRFNSITGSMELLPGFSFNAATGEADPLGPSADTSVPGVPGVSATLPPAGMFAGPPIAGPVPEIGTGGGVPPSEPVSPLPGEDMGGGTTGFPEGGGRTPGFYTEPPTMLTRESAGGSSERSDEAQRQKALNKLASDSGRSTSGSSLLGATSPSLLLPTVIGSAITGGTPTDRNKVLDAYLAVMENPASTEAQKSKASKELAQNIRDSVPSGGDVTPVATPGAKVVIPIDRNTAYDAFLSVMDNPKATEAQKSEASKALAAGLKGSVPSDIETVFGPQTKSSDRVKVLASDIEKYAGRKYSQLTPDEQTHLDSVAGELVKLHSEVIKSKPSAEVDRTLQSIGTHAMQLQEMDDMNDYSSADAIKAIEAGKAGAKRKGHGTLGVIKSPDIQKKESIVSDIAEGAAKAAELYQESIAMDKPIAASGSLPKEKLDAIKIIATAPVKSTGKELDSTLEKIAGDAWSIPSERSKYRSWFTTYSVLG